MTKRIKLLLVTVAFGVGAFAFAAGMAASQAKADVECNCVAYTCPGYPELECLGHLFGLICDHVSTNCDCPECP